jgi:peptidoglycan/LPS O-acetylase OafA/YrhL
LELDWLRILSIGYVMLHHADDYVGDLFRSSIDTVCVAVSLATLVFVSAVSLTTNYPVLASGREAMSFLAKRVLRIYPFYVVALTLFFLLSKWDLLGYSVSADAFWVNLLLLNIIVNKPVVTLWFVGMIFYFYLFFAVCLFRYSLPRMLMLFFLVMALLAGAYLTGGYGENRYIIYLPAFVLGVLSVKHKEVLPLMSRWWALATQCFLVGVASLLYVKLEGHSIRYLLLMIALANIVFPILVVSRWLPQRNGPLVRAVLFLSQLSYALYLFHRIVFSGLLAIYTPKESLMGLALLLCIGLPLTIVLGRGLQWLDAALFQGIREGFRVRQDQYAAELALGATSRD